VFLWTGTAHGIPHGVSEVRLGHRHAGHLFHGRSHIRLSGFNQAHEVPQGCDSQGRASAVFPARSSFAEGEQPEECRGCLLWFSGTPGWRTRALASGKVRAGGTGKGALHLRSQRSDGAAAGAPPHTRAVLLRRKRRRH